MENYILTLLIFIPVIGALVMLPVSKYMGNDKSKWVALIATALQLLLVFWLYLNFDSNPQEFKGFLTMDHTFSFGLYFQ